uniref:Uncharacterized protein n=1 Tax=uncultured bacterium 259 TaxID=698386 RepID=E3T6Q6_9BACT|nr:protein of unknown function DUF268 [uncultured bacterium 259]
MRRTRSRRFRACTPSSTSGSGATATPSILRDVSRRCASSGGFSPAAGGCISARRSAASGWPFNSQRIFDPRTITSTLAALRLVAFNAVDDQDRLVVDADLGAFAEAHNACGLFEFTKD